MLSLLLLTAFSLLAAVVPAVIYSLIVWWVDRYEKEPWGLLAVTFIWGAIPAVFMSLVAELILGISFSAVFGDAVGQVIQGSAVAPVVEEVVKGLAVFSVFLVFRSEFDGLLDGIVYGALVGFGFGMTENIGYFLGSLAQEGAADWVMVVLVRTMIFGLNHGLFTSITGLGFGYSSLADTAWERWLAPLLALGGAISVHAVHNTFTSLGGELCWPILISMLTDWGGVLIILLVVFLAWDREKRWIVQELSSEKESGVLSRADYRIVASYWSRISAQWRAFSRHGLSHARMLRRLHQLATELAFAKHQMRVSGRRPPNDREITRLREEIEDLSAQIDQRSTERGHNR